MNKHIDDSNDSSPLDGLNDENYEGWESWSRQRWAWEYLSRNYEFREQCKSLPEDKDERKAMKQKIVKRFMLKRFKPCDEPYSSGRPAAFQALKASPLPDGEAGLDWAVHLNFDDVGIVFNLRPSLYGKSSLTAQLKMVQEFLEEKIEQLRLKDVSKPIASNSSANPAVLLRRLRVLDAYRFGHEWETIGESLKSKKELEIDIAELAERRRKDKKPAQQLVEFGYMAILTSPSSIAKIPLTIECTQPSAAEQIKTKKPSIGEKRSSGGT